eukprot:SM000087S23369  [mRNA]  locus=s87:318225:320787:+ [translate_table: standard]
MCTTAGFPQLHRRRCNHAHHLKQAAGGHDPARMHVRGGLHGGLVGDLVGVAANYVDTIGRFQRLVAGLDGSPDALVPSSAPPAAASAVAALPWLVTEQAHLDQASGAPGAPSPSLNLGMGQCSICREALEVGAHARMLPCRHLYHDECIALWLLRANTCPVCRHELPADDLGAELARLCRLAETGGGDGGGDSGRGLSQPLAVSTLDPYL